MSPPRGGLWCKDCRKARPCQGESRGKDMIPLSVSLDRCSGRVRRARRPGGCARAAEARRPRRIPDDQGPKASKFPAVGGTVRPVFPVISVVMRQFLAIKREHPECLLFYRRGGLKGDDLHVALPSPRGGLLCKVCPDPLAFFLQAVLSLVRFVRYSGLCPFCWPSETALGRQGQDLLSNCINICY